jgi:2EXR family
MADLQHFHLFPELPFEIREMVWMSSFPCARSIRARPVLEALSWIYHNRKSRQVLNVKFSYEDSDLIAALRTSKEPRQTVLSVYRPRVTG